MIHRCTWLLVLTLTVALALSACSEDSTSDPADGTSGTVVIAPTW